MTNFYDFHAKNIEGDDTDLSAWRGKVVLVVNVASRCGFTPQYEGLEQLHQKFAAQGFAVMGFPANDFGEQEPGTDAEIKTFCTTRFGVTFPMLAKVAVTGADKHPLYDWLTTSFELRGDVQWNFEKFLVGKDGVVLGRYTSSVNPSSNELVGAVERALQAPGG